MNFSVGGGNLLKYIVVDYGVNFMMLRSRANFYVETCLAHNKHQFGR